MANPDDPTGPTAPEGTAWSSDLPDDSASETATAGSTEAVPTTRRSRRGLIAAGILAAIVLVGVVGALVATRSNDDHGTTKIDATNDQTSHRDDPRGVDPDGDDWTGGGRRQGGRGVDPDGDDWTGGRAGRPDATPSAPSEPSTPTTATSNA